jgi:hypothetical protein
MNQPNPYFRKNSWYFYDETGDEYGPYPTQQDALSELMKYCHELEYGPPWWRRTAAKIRKWAWGER